MDIKDQVHESEKKGSLFGLKELRESRGISFKEVVEATRVSPVMLEALEGDDFSRLPEPVYARAFLKSYAQVLEIDDRELLERYEACRSQVAASENQYEHLRKRKRQPSAVPKIVVLILLFCLASVAVYILWEHREYWYPGEGQPAVRTLEGTAAALEEEQVSRREVPESREVPSLIPDTPGETIDSKPPDPLLSEQLLHNGEERAVTEDQQPVVALEAAPEDLTGHDTASPEAGEAVEDLVLEIRASALTWVRIVRDEEPPEELYLQEGSSISRHALSRFELVIGNAGGAEVIFQGSSLGSLGRQGEVVNLSLPRNSGGR